MTTRKRLGFIAVCLLAFCCGTVITGYPRSESSGSKATPETSFPACSDSQLFQLMKKNLNGIELMSNPIPGEKPTAKCENGHALLEGFSLNASNGVGIALFTARGNQWRFVTFVDTGGAGWVDRCDNYPYEFRSMLKDVLYCPTFDGPNR